MSEFSRWNFELWEEKIYLCKGNHEKGVSCESQQEALSLEETFRILERMQAEVTEIERLRAENERAKHSITKLMTRWPELDKWTDVFGGNDE